MTSGQGCCCCPTPCCIAPNVAPARCCNGPPLLPPFCSPSNMPKFAVSGCCSPAVPPKCARLRCRAAPCNYPNPAYDPSQRLCGPVPGTGSVARPMGSGPLPPAISGRFFPCCECPRPTCQTSMFSNTYGLQGLGL